MGNNTVIAFLKYEGRTLLLELSPLPGKPGYFDASLLGTPAAASTPSPDPLWKQQRRNASPREETIKRAEKFRDWLKKNPGKHPLFATAREVLKLKSPGSAGSTVRAGVRLGFLKLNEGDKPITVELA